MARLLEGKVVAEAIRAQLKGRVAALKAHGVVPGLSVTLVGEDAASQTYVAAKDKAAHEVGLDAWTHRFPATMTQDELLAHVRAQNADPAIHGILVQMPLPKGLDADSVLTAIDPAKDADGFHPFNVGCLSIGRPAPVSCTPAGVVEILRHYKLETRGKRAVVIGRSNIVGKPMAALLLRQDAYGDATVTVAHSRTANLAEVVREADVVIAAIGRPEFVKGDWIKPGAVVIDVGVNRVDDATKARGYRLVGDVEFEAASRVASAITPVPGGVGPMTITMLLSNTVAAAERAAGLAPAT